MPHVQNVTIELLNAIRKPNLYALVRKWILFSRRRTNATLSFSFWCLATITRIAHLSYALTNPMDFGHPLFIKELERIWANYENVIIQRSNMESGYVSYVSTPIYSRNTSNFIEEQINDSYADLRTNTRPSSSPSESWPISDQLWNELNDDLLNVPPSYYVCHHCGVPAHHYIQDCPKKYFRCYPNTPYEGNKRSVGQFLCCCKRKWVSWFCFAGKSQICRKCYTRVFPKKMYSIEMAIDRRLRGFEHHLEQIPFYYHVNQMSKRCGY